MNKNLLIRHIKGETASDECEAVISWINKSEDNESYYINLMNTIVMENVSGENPSGGTISDSVKEDAFRQIQAQICAARNGAEKRVVEKGADEIRGKVVEIGKNSAAKVINFWKIASYAAVVLLFVSVGMNLYQFGGNKENVVILSKVPAVENIMNTYYTENGVKARVLLPDSSVVWLNSGSRIVYPKNFDSDKRRVSFEGEGYFDVVRNPEWPMEVVTPKGMKVEVLGTKFHIKSYDNDQEEQATLFSGRIDISKSSGSKKVLDMRVLKPRESLRFTNAGKVVLTAVADTTKKVAWKKGELLFEQTPMSEVIKMLERWHGVKVVVQDPAVLSYTFTADFSSESIVQIFELFRFTSPIDYIIEDNKVYVKKRNI
ncbi:MAG: DUF4974 domain-containing protein [Bacteroidales bacterium]